MRTIAVVFFILVSTTNLFSQDQIKQGVYSLNGSVSYGSTSSNRSGASTDQSSFAFTPSGSYFVMDQLEPSLNLTYMTNSTSGLTFTSLGLGFGVRYYFPNGQYTPFVGVRGGLSWSTATGQSYSSPLSSYALSAGLDVFLSQSFALEPAVIYSHARVTDQFSNSQFSIGIGVKYFILK